MRYIVPEMEIRVFANENIVTNASGNGDSVQAVKNAVKSEARSLQERIEDTPFR